MKVAQEFYCNNCCGYVRVKINMALNHRITFICPGTMKDGSACAHHHARTIKEGVIYEYADIGRNSYTEEIVPPRSAYFKEPLLAKPEARNGAVITNEAPSMLRQLWVEHFG